MTNRYDVDDHRYLSLCAQMIGTATSSQLRSSPSSSARRLVSTSTVRRCWSLREKASLWVDISCNIEGNVWGEYINISTGGLFFTHESLFNLQTNSSRYLICRELETSYHSLNLRKRCHSGAYDAGSVFVMEGSICVDTQTSMSLHLESRKFISIWDDTLDVYVCWWKSWWFPATVWQR